MIDFRLYMITHRKRCAPRALQSVVREACEAGVRAIQLREKNLTPEDLEAHTARLLEVTRRHDTVLVINRNASLTAPEDVFLAASTGADGFHFPDGVEFPYELRERFPRLIVGVSAHSPDRAIRAASLGADFITYGPVFETRSRTGAAPPRGLGSLSEACRSAGIPVYAVGGVTPQNAADCIAAGAHGVAVVGALMESEDVTATVKDFERAMGSL